MQFHAKQERDKKIREKRVLEMIMQEDKRESVKRIGRQQEYKKQKLQDKIQADNIRTE